MHLFEFFLRFKPTFLVVLVSMSNIWIWKLLNINQVIFVCLIILSYALYRSFMGGSKWKIITLVILMTTYMYLKIHPSSINFWQLTSEQEVLIGKRHQYLAHELGRLYSNKVAITYFRDYYFPILNLKQKLYYLIDPNVYFFGGHPRELTEIEEFEKYPFIFLPFFLMGIAALLKKSSKFFVFYLLLSLLLSVTLDFSKKIGPVLMFPIVNVLITEGIVTMLRFLKKLGLKTV